MFATFLQTYYFKIKFYFKKSGKTFVSKICGIKAFYTKKYIVQFYLYRSSRTSQTNLLFKKQEYGSRYSEGFGVWRGKRELSGMMAMFHILTEV